jgi:hypothetical protein
MAITEGHLKNISLFNRVELSDSESSHPKHHDPNGNGALK